MDLRILTYHLPFLTPFKTANETIRARRGLFIQLKKQGITTWGEAAPLPGFSRETLGQTLTQLKNVRKPLEQMLSSDFSLTGVIRFCNDHQLLPSLQFALFTMGCSYLAQVEGKSLHHFLFPDPISRLPLNAVIDLQQTNIEQQVTMAVKNGFETIKIKVDSSTNIINTLKNMRNQHPALAIRLDANQSWSMTAAKNFLKKIEPCDIAYCEEPLLQSTAAALNELQKHTTVPIALDESLIDQFDLAQAQKMVPVLIIKPMMIGLAKNWQRLQSIASGNRRKLVFTSSLESGVGRLMTAALTTGLGAKNTAHGLATGNRLQKDCWSDRPFISHGTYSLPNLCTLKQLMQFETTDLQVEIIHG